MWASGEGVRLVFPIARFQRIFVGDYCYLLADVAARSLPFINVWTIVRHSSPLVARSNAANISAQQRAQVMPLAVLESPCDLIDMTKNTDGAGVT